MLKSNGLTVIGVKSLGVEVHSVYSYGSLVWTKTSPITYIISLSASSNTIGAQGGNITLTISGTKTSLSPSGEVITESFTPVIEISGSGFSLNNNILVVESRGIIVGTTRTGIITASYPEATTQTVTIT